ncbi:MAG: anthranilate synthase component I [Leptolyngbya sp. PLA3]|nr:MAG: anthranilate synthase component I [Cyanobacteria bacterium CYA]MCE7968900.1 anthranilate synthase component I [Leptolyngbya sp. PL-A3]
MPSLSREQFVTLCRNADEKDRIVVVPVGIRLLSDQLTPVLAYRRLVSPDERTAPSFLLESVEGGERMGRHSLLGSRPALEVVATGERVELSDHRLGARVSRSGEDPFDVLRATQRQRRLLMPPGAVEARLLPDCVLGGWFGYAGYDSVRYAEPGKLPWSGAPGDDRALPDLHFGYYDGIVVFDHIGKLVHLVQLVEVEPGADAGEAYDAAIDVLDRRADEIQEHSKPLPLGRVDQGGETAVLPSNMTREQHAAMLARAKEYIRAGDIFQVVLGQRFERRSKADPFDIYRALRAVNPSPYMVYMQAAGCILVASSPEILCRVRREQGRLVVTNRPLAGTRRRGATPQEDAALEAELLADPKERAEHVMLVDLGRNDVGRVAEPGSIRLDKVMAIERYSHVMHISSTVTGELRAGLDAWDALRAALPVGTISGAPKIRAMQIIDELEPVRRGPYGGGMGWVSLDGQMDIALTLRTIVAPTGMRRGGAWTYHIQAAGGIVADSQPEAEYMETVSKAAAMARAVDLAEHAFA